MTLGLHVKEWRVDTAHSRHPMCGCHTTAIRLFMATFSLSVDYKTWFGVLSEFDT